MAAYRSTLLGIVGGRDFLISPDEWDCLGLRLQQAGVRHELIDYPEAEHGFLCEDRPESHDVDASGDAWKRLLDALVPLRPAS
ncbi:dienelactone hydrolase family protein [Streptomyces sp. NPDC048438]|uniref:dienelactone hydrolase family protein n=1 Tax=Streptomyces sp. NPDC048438 TaxID=3365551 RepID=UPI0037129E4C